MSGVLPSYSPEQRSRIRSNLFPAYLRVPDRHRADPAGIDRHNRYLSIVIAEFLALFVTMGFLIAKRKKYHYA